MYTCIHTHIYIYILYIYIYIYIVYILYIYCIYIVYIYICIYIYNMRVCVFVCVWWFLISPKADQPLPLWLASIFETPKFANPSNSRKLLGRTLVPRQVPDPVSMTSTAGSSFGAVSRTVGIPLNQFSRGTSQKKRKLRSSFSLSETALLCNICDGEKHCLSCRQLETVWEPFFEVAVPLDLIFGYFLLMPLVLIHCSLLGKSQRAHRALHERRHALQIQLSPSPALQSVARLLQTDHTIWLEIWNYENNMKPIWNQYPHQTNSTQSTLIFISQAGLVKILRRGPTEQCGWARQIMETWVTVIESKLADGHYPHHGMRWNAAWENMFTCVSYIDTYVVSAKNIECFSKIIRPEPDFGNKNWEEFHF